MKTRFYSILFICTLFNCNTIRKNLTATISQGEILKESYIQEVPFEYHNKFIFIPIKINDKEYQFIYDTGNELTAIDDDVANEITDSYEGYSASLRDVNSNSINTQLTTLKKMYLGDIAFDKFGAQITDLSILSEFFGCKTIHGIIGSNVIKKAKWQIDYKTKTIRFSDDLNRLLDKNSRIINTVGSNPNQLYLEIKLNDISHSYLLDTGYNGYMKSNNLEIFEKLKIKEDFKYLNFQSLTYGAFSKKTDTLYRSLIQNVSLGNLSIKHQVVDFKNSTISNIGNDFFKNFILTIDWNEKSIYLNDNDIIKENFYKGFEINFGPNYKTNMIEVNRILNGNTYGIVVGTKLLKINDFDVSNFNKEELCKFWRENERKIFDTSNELPIEILVNGKPQNMILRKKELLK